MKTIKTNRILTKLTMLVTIACLSLFLGTGAMAATTNSVQSTPLLLIGDTGLTAGTVTIVENSFGTLSDGNNINTFAIQLPAGVTFGSAPTAVITDGDGVELTLGNAGEALLSGNDSLAYWTVTASSEVATTITIALDDIDVADSVDEGNVVATITTAQGILNPGLTEGSLTIGVATEGGAVAVLPDSVNVAIGDNIAIDDIEILESTAGSLSTTVPNTIVLTLPSGVTFLEDDDDDVNVPQIDGRNGDDDSAIEFEDTADAVDAVLSSGNRVATWEITTPSENPSTVTISNLRIFVDDTYTAGAVEARLVAGDVVDETFTIATAAESGVTLTAVAQTGAFNNDPTAIEEEDLPSSPAGRVNVTAASLMIVENFANDLHAEDADEDLVTDTLRITLSSGATFTNDPTITVDGIDPLVVDTDEYPDPTGHSSINLTVGDLVAPDANPGGLLIGDNDTNPITVNLASDIPVGFVTATLSGTVGGVSIDPITVNILEVIASAVTVEGPEDVLTIGIGATSAIGTLTIEEANEQALLANGSTITFTLPEGVTWAEGDNAPQLNETTDTSLAVSLNPISVSTDDRTATFQVTTASNAPATVALTGSVVVDSDFGANPVTVEVGGTAGASGSAVVANTARGVMVSVTSTPTLVIGDPTQNISNIVLTENFAGALGEGSFRLLTRVGKWSTNDPEISSAQEEVTEIVAGDDDAPDGTATFDNTDHSDQNVWDFRLDTTTNDNDTLVVYIPDNIATDEADTITLSLLRLSLPPDAEEGEVNIILIDGNEDGDDTAGIERTELLAGYIGEFAPIAATPDALELPAGTTAEVTLAGGIGDYTVESADDTIATAVIDGSTLTITGEGEGVVELTIGDSTVENEEIVTVTVRAAATLTVDPAELALLTGADGTVAIAGGFSPYGATSADETVATVSVDGNTLTVTAAAGITEETSVVITVTDDNEENEDATVTVTVSPIAPLAVVDADGEPATTVALTLPKEGEEPATATLTVSGGVTPYEVNISDDTVATATIEGAAITVTAVAPGTDVILTVTDAGEADPVTVTVTVSAAPVPVPDEPTTIVAETAEQIMAAPVSMGGISTDPESNDMDLVLGFPAYEGGVDQHVLIVLPNGAMFSVNEDNGLVQAITSFEPFRVGVTDAQDVSIFQDFPVCTPFGGPTLEGGEGLWNVFWLVGPTNGGDLIGLLDGGVYELGFYAFEVDCD